MSPRLLGQTFSSFVAFYSCSRQLSTRTFSTCRSQRFPFRNDQRKSQLTRKSKGLGSKRHFHATNVAAASKNPYEVLGVKPDASQADIKKSYFSLARKYHPDTNPDKDAREKFQQIQEAYDTLKDEKSRAAYDKYGSASQQPGFDPNAFGAGGFPGGGFGGGFGGFRTTRGGFSFGGFDTRGGASQADLFEQLFGAFGGAGPGGARRTAGMHTRGSDIEATITVSFLDACKGATKTVNIQPVVKCDTCSGSGLKPGAQKTECGSCHGTGEQTFTINNGFMMATTCETCGGEGTSIPKGGRCSGCGGTGRVRTKKTVQVSIPAGIDDGMTIRVPGAGDASLSGTGPTGDLLVRVHVQSSNVFQRQGNNIYYNAQIPFYTALLGGKVRVPTLDGNVDVRVPNGTQPGEEMVLRGRGVPNVTGPGQGDLFVRFGVRMPRSMSKRQRELIQLYADEAEGRSPPSSADSSSSSTKANNESTSSKDGEAHFSDSTNSGGWLGGAMRKLRDRLGF